MAFCFSLSLTARLLGTQQGSVPSLTSPDLTNYPHLWHYHIIVIFVLLLTLAQFHTSASSAHSYTRLLLSGGGSLIFTHSNSTFFAQYWKLHYLSSYKKCSLGSRFPLHQSSLIWFSTPIHSTKFDHLCSDDSFTMVNFWQRSSEPLKLLIDFSHISHIPNSS